MTTKSVLRNCYFEVSKGNRECRRNRKHKIAEGQRCLVFKDSMQSPKSYCIPCARIILEKARGDLENLLDELE